MNEGSCLCGQVTWQLDGPLELMTHCHCSRCRKAHGAAFATYVAGPASSFRLRGTEHVARWESSPGFFRCFCAHCGSVAPSENAFDGRVFVPAGNFENDPEGKSERCVNCHCSRCRRARSAAHASNLFTAAEGVRFTRRDGNRSLYKIPEARFFTHVFCRTCGSSASRIDRERGIAIVPMGSLDDDPGIRPQLHVFVGSKAPWYEITDDLPQYLETPPSR